MMKSQGLTWVWDEGRTLWKMAVIRLIWLPILHNRDSSQFVLDDNCLKAYIFPIIYIMERKNTRMYPPKTHVEDLTSPFSITAFFLSYAN